MSSDNVRVKRSQQETDGVKPVPPCSPLTPDSCGDSSPLPNGILIDMPCRPSYPDIMLPQWIIEKKRDGLPISEEEIRFLIDGYTRNEIPDYQMAAFAMAVFMKGMTFDEVATLTDAMMRSGDLIDTSCITQPKADKHSTGGIGDKVSLVLAPLVACCGVAVPMISGRGLGITGGTLDKLESIPGYRTDLSTNEFLAVLQKCGCSIIGQTATLAPADKKLYALRDVTGTVPSIPLISASIMSKKLAEGTDVLVLDVKCGRGAFMKTPDQARELADTIVEIGARMGTPTAALMTNMDQPLGHTAGNALEVIEAIETLRGDGPDDLLEETLELSAQMLILSKAANDHDTAIAQLQKQIDSGHAYETFKKMVELHGGDVSAVDDTAKLPAAKLRSELTALTSGYVISVDAEQIGRACIVLGGGRRNVDDAIDHSVGISHIAKVGDSVGQGGALVVLHANDQSSMDAATRLLDGAIVLAEEDPGRPQLILELIPAKE